MRNEYTSPVLKHSAGKGYNQPFQIQEWADKLSPLNQTNYVYSPNGVGDSPLYKQRLSPKAAKAKAARDLDYAKTDDRTAKKAHAQRMHRKDPNGKGKDWDHEDGRWESVKQNRGNEGEGTKKESGKNYKVK